MRSMSDEQTALVAFVVMSVLAGGNAVAIRYSNRELEPLWGAGLRFALATALLAVLMLALRLPPPRGRALTGSILYGVLAIGAAFALAYYGLVRIHAGLGQTLLALVPLLTLFLAVIGGALCFAQAAILVRHFPRVHPVAMNAVGMGTGALLLIGGALVARQPPEAPIRAETWLAIGYLVPIGSVLVFVMYIVVLRYWTASRAAYEFVLIPVFTLALSAWLDDEPITAELVVGGLLVLIGVYVGALRSAATEPA